MLRVSNSSLEYDNECAYDSLKMDWYPTGSLEPAEEKVLCGDVDNKVFNFNSGEVNKKWCVFSICCSPRLEADSEVCLSCGARGYASDYMLAPLNPKTTQKKTCFIKPDRRGPTFKAYPECCWPAISFVSGHHQVHLRWQCVSKWFQTSLWNLLWRGQTQS